MCEREREVCTKERFSRERERQSRKGMHADMSSHRDCSGRENSVEGQQMSVKIGAKGTVCGDDVEQEDLFAVMDETRLTGKEGTKWKRERRWKRLRRLDSSGGWGRSGQWFGQFSGVRWVCDWIFDVTES